MISIKFFSKTACTLLVLALLIHLQSCSGPPKVNIQDEIPKPNLNDWNISILLDLSDRVDPKKFPEQDPNLASGSRDIQYIYLILESFKNHIIHKKMIEYNDRIKLFLEPNPNNLNTSQTLDKLDVKILSNEFSQEDLPKIGKEFINNTTNLYKLNLEEQKNNEVYDKKRPSNTKVTAWKGSDIHRFLSTKIQDGYAFDKLKRNYLVILTDGELYYLDNEIRSNNKTNFITSKLIQNELEPYQNNWKQEYINQNYGPISTRNGLDSLHVLVIGINQKNPNNLLYEEILQTYWMEWLTSMGIKSKNIQLEFYDLPTNIKDKIANFFQ